MSKKIIMSKLKIVKSIKKRIDDFLARRPHRSFHLTKRRDYKRSLKLPGYIAFSRYVCKILWDNRRLFILLVLFIAAMTGILAGLSSQELFTNLSATLKTASESISSGDMTGFSKISTSFSNAITNGSTEGITDVQQVYVGVILLIVWLATVWLLRNILAGNKVKLRDGLYNSGAPILPTFLIALILFLQLVPVALAVIGYGAASLTGLLDGGVEAMLFWAVASLLTLISVYFVSGTIFALIIITLPGMYPITAIRTAGDLVLGRRLRIIFRLLVLILQVTIGWLAIIIPLTLFDSWIKGMFKAISSVPTMPIIMLFLSALTMIYASSYIYLLYRKVVDDGADPA